MDRETRRRLEEYRREDAGPVENTLIDEFVDGEMDRHEFLHRGALLGLSATAIGYVLAAARDAPVAFAGQTAVGAGGRLRVAISPPSTPIEPQMYVEEGAAYTGSIAGEFLTRRRAGLPLQPELAVGWKPNADATEWTVKLRPNVKFQTGQMMTADDVVATFKRLCDPKASPASQALSVFAGILTPDGITRIDSRTVKFALSAPYAAFPYAISTTTYQAIVLPANYEIGTFVSRPQCTGAFKLTAYNPGVGARYEPFPDWWGGRAPLAGVDVTYFSESAAADAALLGGRIDLITKVGVTTDRPLFGNPKVKLFRSPAANHRELAMRVDLKNPFSDYRVRQAAALSLNRPAIIKTLFSGIADLGNDSPFAPAFLSTVGPPQVPQRRQNLANARQLLEAAGYDKGFSIPMTVVAFGEIPALAQIVQESWRKIGIKTSLKVMTQQQFFAGTTKGPPSGWGNAPWLNATVTIEHWFDRAVPNVYLSAAFKSRGIWSASHYSNKRFDSLLKSYLGAISVKDQRKYAKQIELLLLHDTPVIIPYFLPALSAGSQRVRGYKADATNVYLSRTSLV